MAVTDLTGTTWVLNDTATLGNLMPSQPAKGSGNSIKYELNGMIIFDSVEKQFTSITANYSWYWSNLSRIGITLVGSGNIYYLDSNEAYHVFLSTDIMTFNNAHFEKTISITGGADATNADFISWLEANATQQGATPRKSVDLTTLPGWSSLSSGSHSITIVAKAEGYRDSEPSAAVSVEKAAGEYTDCITFTGESSDFTLAVGGAKEWDGTVEYSTDHNTWTVWNGSEISSSNKKLYLRGRGNTTFWTGNGAQFVLSARAGCSGNLNTLLEYSNPPTTLSASYCYWNMFYGCTNLTTAPELPATTLAVGCYYEMFYGCTSLTSAPALPATTLAEECYIGMFGGCTNLTTAPALPATTLAVGCYSNMFSGCTNLTTAPELPATTLAERCYSSMFHGCTNLTTAPALPATTLDVGCYSWMFTNCTSLTTAPALPATTLGFQCYSYMFNGCTAFKVSSAQTGTYQYAWRIPTSGTISDELGYWNESMLSGTGGTFTSDPSINTTYYVENEPV